LLLPALLHSVQITRAIPNPSKQPRNYTYSINNPTNEPHQVKVRLTSLGWRHNSRECARTCARRTACFCNQSNGIARIRLLT